MDEMHISSDMFKSKKNHNHHKKRESSCNEEVPILSFPFLPFNPKEKRAELAIQLNQA